MVANSVSTTCGTCQPTDGYLATQNWNIISSNWTDLDVIAEFDTGFGPQITQMEGFRRYTAAKTGNASTVFVMSVLILWNIPLWHKMQGNNLLRWEI